MSGSTGSTSNDIKKTLRIAIAGGGIGGVSAALALSRAGFANVDVYESASKLADVGAGINVGPNFYRILKRWGIADRLAEIGAVAITGTCIRKGDSDRELAYSAYDKVTDYFQAPIWVCHRADLHRCMVEAVQKTDVRLNLGCEVTSVDFDRPAIKYRKRGGSATQPGEEHDWIEYDLLIAADGVKSNIRKQMMALHGEIDDAQDTGQAAYRILIPREQMLSDPDLAPLIEEPTVTRWIAARRHIIAYPISNKSVYNISTAHPDEHLVQESWTSRGSKADLMKTWHDYCPRIQKMLQMVPEGDVLEWKLRTHSPLRTWVQQNTILIGDASHPTLPHLAQGAAQACEDSAVIGAIFDNIKSIDEINALLKLVEKARKSRAENIVNGAHENGKAMQLQSGPEMEARDKAFEAVKTGGPNPDRTADPKMQEYLFGWDCVAEARKLYEQEYAAA